MEKGKRLAVCKKIASFIVYACEGEQYLSLIEAFRNARSRREWMDAICKLIHCGLSQTENAHSLAITQQEWHSVCQFIQYADIEEVRQLHEETMRYIATLELKKIHELEQYITSVLLQLEREEEG
ncbi:hypothetical protein MK805_00920 [Shimazuella sp. AN120528]|uniref:hypothetical protein n=1 Tax=Shimazuella soli TaxID=1892854 RepID=UPI001F0CF427|nr:hypothetical protein [Shimazuella soli]MCH5583533.1 hypothetical protein [Shimazuella soli]